MKTKLKIKQEEGITLIALVVTIVVLLILAGVSISLVLNNNGVISKAKDSKNSTERGQAQDEVNLAINYLQIEDATSTLTQEDRRKILEDELRKISADSSVSISGLGYKITHKKYDFFVDKDLNISSSEKTFDTVEWDKKAAPEDIFIWKSDDPNNADYGVIIGYTKNVDNYTVLRFPSRCTKVTNDPNSVIYHDTDDDATTIRRSNTNNILKVELPDTVKELGVNAFGVSFSGAFNFSSLERVELSKSLSKIDNYAFNGCNNLKYIEIPDNITEIGDGAFSGCGKLNIEIPDNITKIGSYAFSGWKAIESITIPAGVKEIGAGCFSDCTNLQQINLPEGLEKIGKSAFSGTSLERVKLPKSLSKIEDSAFDYCGNLKYIEIPENVTEIGSYAFRECKKLESITIPKNVETIGNFSFSNCTNLQQINLPEGVKKIGDNCFYECRNLQQVNLPEGLKEIGDLCFSYCSNLQQINLPDGLEKIGYEAFDNTTSLSEIIIPESVKTIDSWAFADWTASQTIKCKATEAGENWNKYWNYSYSGGIKESSCKIIWGYQDSNT